MSRARTPVRPNKERGVYKTTDGGKTWNTLSSSTKTLGFTDLVMDASDSKTLYARPIKDAELHGASWRWAGIRNLEDH